MTLTAPADPSALLPRPETAPEPPPRPPRAGLAGLVAEIGRQRRANASARRDRREATRDRRASRRAVRRGTTAEHPDTGFGAWVRALPGRLQESGVQVGYLMALAGSGVGQLSWWSTQVPLWLAASFALTFEALMIGASRRGLSLRSQPLASQRQAAITLRLIAWSAAGVGTGFNWWHLHDPATTLVVFGQQVHGSFSLGFAFAAFTAAGFLTHELSTHADVRHELIRKGHLHPLGIRRCVPPFTLRAWRTHTLLIEQPELTMEQAWAHAARPRRRTPESGADKRTVPSTTAEASSEAIPADDVPEPEAPTPSAQTADGAESADPPRTAEPESTTSTDELLSDDVWMELLQPVAAAMFHAGDWISLNEVILATGQLAEGSKGVGKRRGGRLLERLEQECPAPPPQRQRGNAHRERLHRAIARPREVVPA